MCTDVRDSHDVMSRCTHSLHGHVILREDTIICKDLLLSFSTSLIMHFKEPYPLTTRRPPESQEQD